MKKETYDKYLNILTKYYEEYGNLNIKTIQKYNDINIGNIIVKLRKEKNSLTKLQIQQLESLGMQWEYHGFSGTSVPEQLLYYYIKKLYSNSINRYNDLGFELDIFIPSLSIGIEYDGEIHKNKEENDIKKNILANENNIILIRIINYNLKSLSQNTNHYYEINLKKEYKEKNYCDLDYMAKMTISLLEEITKNKINVDIDTKRDIQFVLHEINGISKNWMKNYNIVKEITSKDNISKEENTIKVNWLKKQRYLKDKLSPLQIKLLNDINIDWNPYENKWYESYNKVLEYYNINKTINVPQTVIYKGLNLGIWINHQRDAFLLTDSRRKMTEERKNLLENIGIIWDMSNSWCQEYEYYKMYYLNILNGENIDYWINKQIDLKNNNELSKYQLKLLSIINFNFDLCNSPLENSNVIQLWDYEKNGNIPKKLTNTYFGWKCNNNHRWNEDIHNIIKNPICPYCNDEKLLVGFNDLKTKYDNVIYEWDYEKNTETPDEILYNSNKKYYWICPNCKKEYLCSPYEKTIENKNCPYCERATKTNKIPEITKEIKKGSHEERWNKKYILARNYYFKNNNLLIHIDYVENDIAIGSWIDKQRQKYKNNKLSSEKIKLLEEIGMVWSLRKKD